MISLQGFTPVILLCAIFIHPVGAILKYEIEEELPPDTFIGNIIADSGLDQMHSADVIQEFRFNILPGKSSQYFSVDSEYGLLRVNSTFDREVGCLRKSSCVLDVDVAIVSPQRYFQVFKVQVTILDVNDNTPQFPSEHVTLTIPESAPLGMPGFTLEGARDRDSGSLGVQHYVLESSSRNFGLNVVHNLDDSFDLHLLLNGSLDHETEKFYTLKLVAVDGGDPPRSGSVTIDVDVTDSNDNSPQFEQPSYEVNIPEDISESIPIIQVRATDPDDGLNGQLQYFFASETQEFYGDTFRIDNATGEIFIRRGVNSNLEERYELIVQAQDMGVDSLRDFTKVHIQVDDVNNHAPVISVNMLLPSGHAGVKENIPRGAFVAHVSAEDQDRGQNGAVTCRIEDQNFQLIQLYGAEYKIVSSVMFDREIVSSYHITIACEDQGTVPLKSSRDLIISILDENDHSPVFSQDSFTERLTENNQVGIPIARMTATDRDEGDNAIVTYGIRDVNSQLQKPEILAIDPHNGLVTTLVSLDREKQARYIFEVTAMDGGYPQHTSTATLTLSIDDVNDERPIFSQAAYSFGTFENQGNGTEIGTLSAHDMDLPPYNIYEFTLIPLHSEHYGTFYIDKSSGRITTRRVLDRETNPAFYLTAVVYDKLNPDLSSSASVTVYVADRNDNSPVAVFPSPSNKTTSVSYYAPVGYIFTKVLAHDDDLGSNAKLTFSLTSGNDEGLFDIDPSIGAIFVNTPLHVHDSMYPSSVKNVYLVTITISDSGSPPRSTSTLLHIDVDRTKDPDPQTSTSMGYHQKIIIILGAVTGVLVVILIAAIVLVKKRQVHQAKSDYVMHRQNMTYLTPTGLPPPGSSEYSEKESECAVLSGTQDVPLCSGYPGTLPPYSYYPPAVSKPHDDPAERLQGLPLFTKEQDSESGCSGEVSNADSGHGPSEEGDPHNTSQCQLNPSLNSVGYNTSGNQRKKEPVPPPRIRSSYPRGRLQPPGVGVAHARPQQVQGPYFGMPLESFQPRNNSLTRDCSCGSKDGFHSDSMSRDSGKSSLPPPVPKRQPITKLSGDHGKGLPRQHDSMATDTSHDDDNMSDGGSSTSGSFTVQLDESTMRSVDV